MSDLRKAAEAVLEAWGWDWSEPRNEALKERMEALRQALAQPVDAVNMSQERVDETAKREHEPYGYVWTSLRDGMEVRFSRMPPNKFYNPQDIKPVYTAPLKREWVGLTEEEFSELLYFGGQLDHVEVPLIADLIRTIQAKLKEKNT